MNAALYFELVDAVARVDGKAGLTMVAERIAATPMHPLERRVLDRALRARSEALIIQGQLMIPREFHGTGAEPSAVAAHG